MRVGIGLKKILKIPEKETEHLELQFKLINSELHIARFKTNYSFALDATLKEIDDVLALFYTCSYFLEKRTHSKLDERIEDFSNFLINSDAPTLKTILKSAITAKGNYSDDLPNGLSEIYLQIAKELNADSFTVRFFRDYGAILGAVIGAITLILSAIG